MNIRDWKEIAGATLAGALAGCLLTLVVLASVGALDPTPDLKELLTVPEPTPTETPDEREDRIEEERRKLGVREAGRKPARSWTMELGADARHEWDVECPDCHRVEKALAFVSGSIIAPNLSLELWLDRGATSRQRRFYGVREALPGDPWNG